MIVPIKPILAVTLGDAAGSGPELITKAFADPQVRAVCRPLVVGDAATLRAALSITGVAATVRPIARAAEVADDASIIDEKRLRRAVHTPIDGGSAVAIRHHDRVGIAELREPIERCGIIVLPVEANQRQLTRIGDAQQHVVFDTTLRTPGPPDVDGMPTPGE